MKKQFIHNIFFFFRSEEETEEDSTRFMYGEHSRSTGPPLYPHNTYHGYNHHQRTPLAQANFKPLKFTDSPMNNYNSTGHNSIVDGENVSQDDEVCTLYISHPFGVVNGLPVRFLEKAGLGFDFTKTQFTGTVLGLKK